MALEHIEIRVRWPSGRAVDVGVAVEELIGPLDAPESLGARRGEAVYPLDRDALASRESLLSFLRNATRTEPDGGQVDAVCFEPHVTRLLELLAVEGPPPTPIVVELPADG